MELLQTERLMLRPLTMDDLEAVHRILDLELRWAGEPLPIEDRAEILQSHIGGYDLSPPIPLGYRGIALKAANALIGVFRFRVLPLEARVRALFPLPGEASLDAGSTLELFVGYALSPAHWRQGYATEALGALRDYAFQELQVPRLVVEIERDNERSILLARRVGMTMRDDPWSDWRVVGMVENDRPGAG